MHLASSNQILRVPPSLFHMYALAIERGKNPGHTQGVSLVLLLVFRFFYVEFVLSAFFAESGLPNTLTKKGQQQMYELGIWLRERYQDQLFVVLDRMENDGSTSSFVVKVFFLRTIQQRFV